MNVFFVGIDIGSTTVKVVVMDEENRILHKFYERHYSKVREKTAQLMENVAGELSGAKLHVAITGSAGLGVSQATDIPFVQEVYSAKLALEAFIPDADMAIELGGEDSKILFLTGGVEERMNGTCAGGTGAFIDQMASLLGVTIEKLDEMSLKHNKIYNIASRCGVFAKSDIQQLFNQGAAREDIAASIHQAIVDQIISGLAQGRKIGGKIAFLGGPLTFQMGLRERFCETLKLSPGNAVFPEDAQYYMAIGAAIYSKNQMCDEYESVVLKLKNSAGERNAYGRLAPLFRDQAEYREFLGKHTANDAEFLDIKRFQGDAYLGIDAGSTTTKMVLISKDGGILYSFYAPNAGDPVSLLRGKLLEIYALCGNRIRIVSSAVTGYGEELIKSAFGVGGGIVETVAHYYAAKHFCPNVDFILDIGGQDIKCFKIKNGTLDSLMLNEACSSGCGSFIETFAKSLGYSVKDFAEMALFAENPVDLGSRCTVFMNSSVKQAQKEGATVADISAGLAASVVKNAIYKVIRARSKDELGENIVVQGGTFLNDAILRSFEREIGKDVVRPSIAGLMGAYGTALFAVSLGEKGSGLIDEDGLLKFSHNTKTTTCGLCTNRCTLTVNTFANGARYISGNKCQKPTGKRINDDLPNAYAYKLSLLKELVPKKSGKVIGLPVGLNMYENLPFWHALLTDMGFEVRMTEMSTRDTYKKGQHTIPSDTVCYPAKLMHGHLQELIEDGVEDIFYPCLPYNFDEKLGDNHYNCPVVAYYPELLRANNEDVSKVKFHTPYFYMDSRRLFLKEAVRYFENQFDISKEITRRAVKKAYAALEQYKSKIRKYAREALDKARKAGIETVILAGRPYHIDPEINHGIDKLINSLGLAVLSEDSVSAVGIRERVHVLNQWTYHARLYSAAKFAAREDNVSLVQLVSFGCGLDAVTSDEVREIVEKSGKIYTQIKMDEISNLGAVRIRIRSLKAAIDLRKNGGEAHNEQKRGSSDLYEKNEKGLYGPHADDASDTLYAAQKNT